MPESFEIDAPREIVRSRAWGVLTDKEVRKHYERLAADKRFRSSYRQLIDLRDVTEFRVPASEVLAGAFRRVFAPGVQRAVVAADETQYGLARMFASFAQSDSQTVQVFREIGRAEEWLGL